MQQHAFWTYVIPRLLAAVLLLSATRLPARAQLVFEFVPGPALAAFSGSDPVTAMKIGAGVTEAGAIWSSSLFDPITVKITVDLDPTLPIFASAAALSVKIPTLYTSVSGALTTDAITSTDLSAVAALQPGPKIEAITHDTSVTTVPSPEIRLGGASTGIWNTTLAVTRPNLKALGLLDGLDGTSGADGTLMINPSLITMFDFTRTDGILPGMLDFTGIAIHEIGHLMGFFSGVDDVDYAGDGAPDNPLDLSDTAIFSVLDLFRYSPHSLAADSQPTSGAVNDWRFGPAPASFLPKPFFSVEPGVSGIAPFATGTEHGDGAQASHFASGVAAIMDPSFPSGTIADPTSIDITAMDAIGWNAVPEPSAVYLLIGALALRIVRRVRNSS